MNLKRNRLRDAVCMSLILGTTLAGNAFAQQATQDQKATEEQKKDDAKALDTVVVTGSRIRSQTFTASSPVTEVSAEDFKTYGATTVEDLVNQMPQIDPSFDNFQNNGSAGHATISMRGLGASRTLTLVNGRRLPASRNELTDPSIIPAAALKRVDILSGGASAVYGADAVAGVVNFILDDTFEGINFSYGFSAYQHNNRNKTMQGLLDQRKFKYPTGNSGFDGKSRNIDIVAGSSFADNRGHAMGWLTWRQNDALYHGDRDYSSCAVYFDTPLCGGSGTADPARFVVNQYANGKTVPWPLPAAGQAPKNANYVYSGGRYQNGSYVYNYAPINFYQRPDNRVTAGFMTHYEVNEHFTPYLEAMFMERHSEMQIAESGAFGVPVVVDCTNPRIGTLCADAGVTTPQARILMYKRNVEGGPRHHSSDDTTYRVTAGVRGNINDAWTYDVSAVYGTTKTTDIGTNDFLISRVASAALGCNNPAYPSFPGCQPWDVWTGAISPSAAQAMAGTSFAVYRTSYKALSAVFSGNLGFGFPSAGGEKLGLAWGWERRWYSYSTDYDTDSRLGNFAGAGAADLPVKASNSVQDLFGELAVPIYVGSGFFNRLDASLGYRHSSDQTMGKYNTYKFGLSSKLWDEKLLIRAGYNRAVRAPSLNALYYPQRLTLSSTDLCAGPTPKYTAAQCAKAGVPTNMYGFVPVNPANQYNALTGGNPNLAPELADTYTVGFALEPIKNLNLSLDWYNVKIKNAVGSIGYNTIQILCMEQGLFCDRIKRDARAGGYDLYQGLANDPGAGYISNLSDNIGVYQRNGLDLAISYSTKLGGGRLSTSLLGNYILKDFTQTLSSQASTAYDCKGLINDTRNCQTPKWRHVASANYGWDRFTVGARWRYFGKMAYKDVDGTQLSDVIWFGTGVKAYSYLDLNGSVAFGPATLSLGVNNVFDKEPPFSGDSALSANANALGGYDQAGRFFFGSITLKF